MLCGQCELDVFLFQSFLVLTLTVLLHCVGFNFSAELKFFHHSLWITDYNNIVNMLICLGADYPWRGWLHEGADYMKGLIILEGSDYMKGLITWRDWLHEKLITWRGWLHEMLITWRGWLSLKGLITWRGWVHEGADYPWRGWIHNLRDPSHNEFSQQSQKHFNLQNDRNVLVFLT